ncbi:16S rRNA (guanine(966)-N(2))-methyltransferase RsmD [Kordia periserrulae]|uniref:16S rRNA (Guanine(966)-N(2))-methyltransferase RsmD n=1 Tax=Kordia periserrulae TaxID=701523 RepID=A0A2T6C0Y2_9FLAO|nr:RsmD family RNA methyltransferase [Kordia periserrulae]PTX61984.1 16S rRNA (guanine(966)-N(2))-methyltransferase RsmD [Kordia periserrulae]
MRIISGKHKGRRLQAPKKLPVRPTTDLAKESLFNILNNHYYFHEISVLDLFSGTGNISYEFASRGTETITAVDGDYGCVSFIKKTAAQLELDITAIKSDVFKFLDKTYIKADIIFADPPYAFTYAQFEQIANTVFERNLLLEDGFLIIEHAKETNLEHVAHFSFSKNYGGSVFSFFELPEASSEEE